MTTVTVPAFLSVADGSGAYVATNAVRAVDVLHRTVTLESGETYKVRNRRSTLALIWRALGGISKAEAEAAAKETSDGRTLH